jgi:PAS domain S-box-containing protein
MRQIRTGIIISIVANFCFLMIAAYLIVGGEQARSREREARHLLAAIVDSSDDAIISKSLEGTISSWNSGAERLYGYKAEEVIGKHIDIIIPPDRREEMKNIFEMLAHGERVDHVETIRVCRDGTPIHVELTVSPLHDDSGRVIGASAIARNVTERKKMEESLRFLTARVLQAEDEERRRIARDLHDSTVQELALLSMNLAQLKGVNDKDKLEASLIQAHQLTNQCVQELRTLTYLLHPPLLDELGLASALKIYAEGFAQRSGITLDIDVRPAWERLSTQVEMALFRIAQESLSNVVKHSGSSRATIKLDRDGEIKMDIVDQGKGIAAQESDEDVTLGVGILGMRERIKLLGGSLSVRSGPEGTSVEARLPLSRG